MKGNEVLNVQGRQTHTASTPKDSKTTLDGEMHPKKAASAPRRPAA